MRRLALFVLVFALACTDDTLAPVASPRDATSPLQLDASPPPLHAFGPDSYQIGLFTGEGTAVPGLHCIDYGAGMEQCDGYLASAVDGTLLDVRLQIPTAAPKPVPLVTLIHGYAARTIPKEYGGLGLSATAYARVFGEVSRVDPSIAVLIGVHCGLCWP